MSGRRPEEPVRLPVNRQTWTQLTFLHFRYDVEAVQRLVPGRLRVQEWDGDTWVGITPFVMRDVRPTGLPAPPGWRRFAELNVRAYVQGPEGRDGLWFLGMVVPRASFTLALRSLGLPYSTAEGEVTVKGDRWSYRFGPPDRSRGPEGRWFRAETTLGGPVPEVERTPLLDSVTGRWAAYHHRARVLWRTPVRHEPWPLHHATVTGDLTAPLRWVGLCAPAGPPMVHAGPAVHTSVGPPRPA